MKRDNICVVGAGPWGRNHIRTLQKIGALGGVVDLESSALNGIKKELMQKPDIGKKYIMHNLWLRYVKQDQKLQHTKY